MEISRFLAAAVLGGLLLGCNRAETLDRIPVTGEITFNGEPVQEGRIRFIPLQAELAPVSIAFVKNGSYLANDRGGVPLGRHRIEILAYDPAEAAARQGGFGQPAPRQLLPSKYNRHSELSVEIAKSDELSIIRRDFTLAP